MAGGPHAAEVACLVCLETGLSTKAIRIHEGIEDDHYRCHQGHEFSIDWSRGAATEPQWPPSPELAALVTKPN